MKVAIIINFYRESPAQPRCGMGSPAAREPARDDDPTRAAGLPVPQDAVGRGAVRGPAPSPEAGALPSLGAPASPPSSPFRRGAGGEESSLVSRLFSGRSQYRLN